MRSETRRTIDGGTSVLVHLLDIELNALHVKIVEKVALEVVDALAKEFILLHGQEVLAKMDVHALANLALARSVPEIAKFLK